MAACQQLVFDRCPAVPSAELRDTSLTEKYYPGSRHPGRIGNIIHVVFHVILHLGAAVGALEIFPASYLGNFNDAYYY
jgi:hypothetical protein